MARPSDEGVRLRGNLDEAVKRGNPKGAIAALEGLVRIEPEEPRWPHRLGEALQRAGRNADAERAWMRAMELLQKQGFLPRAIAVARQIADLNPSRAELLTSLDQQSTRALQAKPLGSPALRLPPPVPMAPLRPPQGPATPPTAPPGGVPPIPKDLLRSLMVPAAASTVAKAPPQPGPPRKPPIPDSPSFVGGMPVGGLAALARPLTLAADTTHDEVRYDDVPLEDSVAIELADFEVMSLSSSLSRIDDPEIVEALRAERVVHLTATMLFSGVSAEALGELARASKVVTLEGDELICQRGGQADALFVVVEGSASMILGAADSVGVQLCEGQAFGEGALLRGGVHPAEVRASGPLTLLRIETADLRRIAESHADVHRALFDLLARRLLTHTLQTSPLFAAFDADQKRELARMFEVRRAAPGIVLEEAGKRCDGLYITLAGEFEIVRGDDALPLAPGSIVGHEALLSRAPARRSVIVLSDSIVLRMPAARFGSFAAQFPPALAWLTDVASSLAEPVFQGP